MILLCSYLLHADRGGKKMRNKILLAAIFVLGGALIVFGAGCSRNRSNIITLAGSTAFQPFAEKLAEQYQAKNKDIHINVQGGGSAVGIQSAIGGNADIGMADLLELPDEAKTLNSTTVARDGIAIIVNLQNRVSAVSSSQAHDIFTGKIANWKEIGGTDAAIRVISREEGSGTKRSFDTLVLDGDRLAPSALFQDSNGTVREAVASDPGAIGYLSIGLVNDRVKPLSYEGIAPTNENVENGEYPLSRPIFFLTKGQMSPAVKAFIDYVLSDEAQRILEEEGLIAVKHHG
jgi:phosphate transport system substrate-binding protein